MKNTIPKYPRILAIAPSTRGFGFAIVEGLNTLVDWGVKNVEGDKNAGSLARVKAMIAPYVSGAKSNSRKTGGLEVDLLRHRFLHSIH